MANIRRDRSSSKLTDRQLLLTLKIRFDDLEKKLDEIKNEFNSSEKNIRALEDFKLELKIRQDELSKRNRTFIKLFSVGMALIEIAAHFIEWYLKL